MVAAANSGHGPAVSHQTQSVEGSGGAQQAKGAKKRALGAFARLLAGLTGKTKAGGKEAAEPGAEAGAGAEKTAGRAKNAPGKKAPEAGIPLPEGRKIHNRDRRFLAALQEEGESPGLEAKLRDGPAKKSKGAQKNSEKEEAALLAAAGASSTASSGALSRDAPLPAGLESDGASVRQEGPPRLEGTENQAKDPPEEARAPREKSGDGTDPGAFAGPAAEAPPEAAAAASPRTQGKTREEPGVEKKDKAAPAETRNSRKNRERFALDVRDLRTEGAAPAPGQEQSPGLEAGAERTADLVVELRDKGGNQGPDQPGRAKTAGRAFEDILARELHQNLNGDIVRQASILVKDGGEGTVRLSIKPESLGMVKVRLEMAENKITGRIIVESNEALRAFEREIHSLEQAFRDSGFAGASLEMALSGDSGQNGQRRWNGDAARALFPSGMVSASYDGMAETMDVLAMEAGFDGFAGPGVFRVNVLV